MEGPVCFLELLVPSSIPFLLHSVLSRRQAPIQSQREPDAFSLEDFLFGYHGIILNCSVIPGNLSKHSIWDNICSIYRGIERCKEFKDAPPPVKSVRLLELLLRLVRPRSNVFDNMLVVTAPANVKHFVEVMDLVESLLFFSLPVSLKPSPCRPAKVDVINYLAPWEAINMSKELLRAIELSLPEAACCSGFLDPCFCNAVQNFSVFRRNVVCQDWSGIVAFMPGLIHDSTSTASIVLAPGHRIPQLLELLQAFVDGLGLFEVKVTYLSEPAIMNELSPGIVLGTPDRMHEALCEASTTWKPHRAVLVETNVLVSTQKVHVEAICSILWSRDVTLGIHSLDPSPGVEDIVTRFCKGETSRIPRPAFTVSSVKHFYAAVKSASDKLAKLGEVWKLFRIRSDTVTVYCNSVSQVELVASGMENAGFIVAATHTGMPQHCIEETNRAFCQRGLLLITNIIYSGRQHVINFDMPESADRYLARAGVHRILWTRKVVSICSELEVCLLHEFERSLGFKADLLVARDHRLNGKKPPRRKN
ncbi:hypothetical protein SELMODRAFT_403535 [Selaginella moellendorffii]|uniref:ATP-dependent RNA helicase n=1 Tax=Selaginella moellendorffii TaxID=88036 RepID=D8QRQ7_SELML|nr:hypothetical protein SELMODRAFT_403535 [Selaginella moellendorffii]